MKSFPKIARVSHDSDARWILQLLSDEEIAEVSRSATAGSLSDGEEYLDLGSLERGVRRALGATTPTRRVLPRRIIGENTWSDILSQLAIRRVVKRRLENGSTISEPPIHDTWDGLDDCRPSRAGDGQR